jgi:hypothetical protein
MGDSLEFDIECFHFLRVESKPLKFRGRRFLGVPDGIFVLPDHSSNAVIAAFTIGLLINLAFDESRQRSTETRRTCSPQRSYWFFVELRARAILAGEMERAQEGFGLGIVPNPDVSALALIPIPAVPSIGAVSPVRSTRIPRTTRAPSGISTSINSLEA